MIIDEPSREGDHEYLRVLHLAAATLKEDVEAVLVAMRATGTPISADSVRAQLATKTEVVVPDLVAYEPVAK